MTTVGVTHQQMFIDGAHVDSEERYDIRHPATEELVCTVAKGTVAHADLAVAAARRAFDAGSWTRMTPEDRSAVMKRIADRLGTELEEITELEIRCNGATIRQALGFHTGLAAPHFLSFAEQAATYEFERDVPTTAYPTLSVNRIRHEPLGVCVAIVPWNFPLVIGIWKIGPALAAGNSVVVKTDEKTPLSLAAPRRDRPRGGRARGRPERRDRRRARGRRRGSPSHPDVDKVAFTGSTAVGRRDHAARLGHGEEGLARARRQVRR